MRHFLIALSIMTLLVAAMFVGIIGQAPGLVLTYLCLSLPVGIAVGRASVTAGIKVAIGEMEVRKRGR